MRAGAELVWSDCIMLRKIWLEDISGVFMISQGGGANVPLLPLSLSFPSLRSRAP